MDLLEHFAFRAAGSASALALKLAAAVAGPRLAHAHLTRKQRPLDQGYSSKDVINAVAQSTGLSTKGAKMFAVDAASGY